MSTLTYLLSCMDTRTFYLSTDHCWPTWWTDQIRILCLSKRQHWPSWWIAWIYRWITSTQITVGLPGEWIGCKDPPPQQRSNSHRWIGQTVCCSCVPRSPQRCESAHGTCQLGNNRNTKFSGVQCLCVQGDFTGLRDDGTGLGWDGQVVRLNWIWGGNSPTSPPPPKQLSVSASWFCGFNV